MWDLVEAQVDLHGYLNVRVPFIPTASLANSRAHVSSPQTCPTG